MKINLKNIYFLLLLLTVISCQQKGIDVYEQRAGIYLKDTTYSYSFVENPDSTVKTLKLPVIITGNATSQKREFLVSVVKEDGATNATEDMYKLHNGIVEAGQFVGYIPLEVKYNTKMDDEIFKVRLKIIASDEFPEVELNQVLITVYFSNKVIMPANWMYLKQYFGNEYSTRWWRFILSSIEMTYFPFYPGHADKETWWMTYNDVVIYQNLVRYKYEKYKVTNGPIIHDDGNAAGQAVSQF